MMTETCATCQHAGGEYFGEQACTLLSNADLPIAHATGAWCDSTAFFITPDFGCNQWTPQ